MALEKIGVKLFQAAAEKPSVLTAVEKAVVKQPSTKLVTAVNKATVGKILGAAPNVSKGSTHSLSLPEFIQKIPQGGFVHKYSKGTITHIADCRKTIFDTLRKTNCAEDAACKMDEYDDILKRLFSSCRYEKVVKDLAGSEEKMLAFRKNRITIANEFRNMYVTAAGEKEEFLTRMTAYKMYASKEYKKLIESKTIQEIAQGKLNPFYVKNAKFQDVLKEDFWEKLHIQMKDSLMQTLREKGIDPKFAMRYLDVKQNFIKESPVGYGNLVKAFEKAENPEVVNSILGRFSLEECFAKDYFVDNAELIVRALNLTNSNLELAQKVLKMKNLDPSSLLAYINMFGQGKDKLKITDEIFNWFLEFEKKNPQWKDPKALQEVNRLLQISNGDEKFVKNFIEQVALSSDKTYALTEITQDVTASNFEYVKTLLSQKAFCPEIEGKISLSKAIGKIDDWNKIDELYKGVAQPFSDALVNTGYTKGEAIYQASRISSLKINKPEVFKQLEEGRIIELIQQRKINPQLIQAFGKDGVVLMPEIIQDAKMLANGESLIKKFDSMKDILRKTSSGDVISVKGKMYINNNGKLEPWKMTEEKFNELFPLVDRFSVRQNRGDCYLIAPMNNMYLNPRTRGGYYKLFEQQGEDIIVTIPAYKEYGGVVRFPQGKINLDVMNWNSACGAKHTQMVEQAYARAAFREGDKIAKEIDPSTTDDIAFLGKRILGGDSTIVMEEFQEVFKYNATTNNFLIDDSKKAVEEILQQKANNPEYIINESYFPSGRNNTGHARAVRGYNPETKGVLVVDPSIAGGQKEVPLEKFLKYLYKLTVTHVG